MEHSDPLKRAVQQRPHGDTWTDEQFLAAREADLSERTKPVRSVVGATVLCLLLATLLTSAKLVQIAERQEFGPARDRQLAVADAVDRVANFLSLNRPYDAVLDLRNVAHGTGKGGDIIDEVLATTTSVPPATTTLPSATSSTTTTTTLAPVIRLVNEASPLRVYVAGDSQAEYLGQAITTESPGYALEVEVDDRISTSLARPDYFNWPAEFAAKVSDDRPEAVVLFIGANDHQDMADSEGNRLVEGTPDWQSEWSARLTLVLDLLAAQDTAVYWVSQPPMRDGSLNAGVTLINQLAQPIVEAHANATYIDIWDLFGGDGSYQDHVVGPSGETIDARVDDGVHVSRSGASWIADLVFARWSEVWEFVG